MLLVYLGQLELVQRQLLNTWTGSVHYWPRSWAHTDCFNAAVPCDWWLLFSQPLYADMWILRYPELTRIMRHLD